MGLRTKCQRRRSMNKKRCPPTRNSSRTRRTRRTRVKGGGSMDDLIGNFLNNNRQPENTPGYAAESPPGEAWKRVIEKDIRDHPEKYVKYLEMYKNTEPIEWIRTLLDLIAEQNGYIDYEGSKSSKTSENLVLQSHQVRVYPENDPPERRVTVVNQTPHTLRLSPLSTSSTMDGPYTDIPSHTEKQLTGVSWGRMGCSVPTDINDSNTGRHFGQLTSMYSKVTFTYTDVKVNEDWYFVKNAMCTDMQTHCNIKLKGSLQDFMDLTQGGQPLPNETMRLENGDRLKYITGDPQITNLITGEIIPPLERPPYQGFCKTDWGGYIIPYGSEFHSQYPCKIGKRHRILHRESDGGIYDNEMFMTVGGRRDIPKLTAHGMLSHQCIDMNLNPSQWHIINTTTHTFDIYSVTGLHLVKKLFSIGPSETKSEDWGILAEFGPPREKGQSHFLIRNWTDPFPLGERGQGRLDRVPPYMLRGWVSQSKQNATIIVDPVKDMNQTVYIAPGAATMEEIQEIREGTGGMDLRRCPLNIQRFTPGE